MAKGNYASTDVNPRGKLGEISKGRKKRKAKLAKSVRLLDSGGTIKAKVKRKKRRLPSEKAKARQDRKSRPLSSTLSEVATSFPEGGGDISRAVKSAVSGASLGALIGESISKARKTRKKRAKQDMDFAKERLGSAALDIMDAKERSKGR